MVMKSLHLILGCCMAFAVSIMIGLSLYSCKSKKMVEQSSHKDSLAMVAYKSETDSSYFQRLIEQQSEETAIQVVYYQPTKDTSFHVTGTYVSKVVNLVHKKQLDKKNDVDKSVEKKETQESQHEVSEDSERKEEPAPKRNIGLVIFILIITGLYLWSYKR